MTPTSPSHLLAELRIPILRSTRPELARDFYNGVLGAGATVLGAERHEADDAALGLIVPTPEGAASRWFPHAVSDDLESVTDRVRESGGTYWREASLFENMLITAPDRSQIIITEREPGEDAGALELPVTLELCTREIETSTEFYTEMLGLTSVPVPNDPYSYRVFFSNETGVAAALDMTTFFRETTESHWIPYFYVTDLDQAVEMSVAYGARVAVPIDGSLFGTRYATLTDPTGATFGLRVMPSGGVFGTFSARLGRFLTPEEFAAQEQGQNGAMTR